MTYYITNIRELQRGQSFHHINKNGIWYCVGNDDENGSVLICNDKMFHMLTYNPNTIDSENDMYVMVLNDVGNEKIQPEISYVINEDSNETHLAVDDRLVCGHRFTQDSIKSETGILTCGNCRQIALKSNILGVGSIYS